MKRVVLCLLLASSLTGCASQSSPSTEASLEASADRPASVAAIESLLSARHVDDLPDAQTLAAHPEPAAALRYIATHHGRMVVRGRALSALRHYEDDATRDLLVQTLLDTAAHPTLRAAAARGSASLRLDDELRAALATARATDDPRVVRAVDTRLDNSPVAPPPAVEPDDVEGSLRAR